MKQSSHMEADLKVGDQVRLIARTLAWKAEMTLRGKIGEVVELRANGRVSVRFGNGRLLEGRSVEPFERV